MSCKSLVYIGVLSVGRLLLPAKRDVEMRKTRNKTLKQNGLFYECVVTDIQKFPLKQR